MREDDDAFRYDQGCQACATCGDLTVSAYQGRPCCLTCYPERKAVYLAMQSQSWRTDEIGSDGN